MDKRVLIICRGIQGSGRSTWAKQWCHEDPEHRVRFNNGDVRNMLGDYWVPSRENVVTATYNTVLAYSMEKGYNIVVDNMNLNPKTCAELEKMVKDFNENYTYDWKYEVEYKDFWTPVDAKGEHPIGEKAKALVQDTNLPAAIIVDMDATVCLNTSGRPFYGEGAAEGMLTDEPITPILELIRNFCDNYPAKLIILTGREDTPEVRKATEQWLENNFLHPDMILMRPANSFVAGPICKKKLYEDNIKGKYYIPFVLEDNCKCVEMWRNEDLICLQPNEGKF